MLLRLALPIIAAVAAGHRGLQAHAPTNLLARRVRAQRPRWRTAAALSVLVGSLVVAMHAMGEAVANGASGWLNLIVLLLAWDAIKISCLVGGVLVRTFWLTVRRVAAALGTWASRTLESTPPWTHVGPRGYPADLR